MSWQRQGLTQVALALTSLFVLVPVLWLIRLAFDGSVKLRPTDAALLPHLWSLANVAQVLAAPISGFSFVQLLSNSLVVAGSTAMVAMLFGTTAAYAFARYRFPGRKIGLLAFLVLLTLPPMGLLAPFVLYFNALQIRDSLLALVLVYSAISVPFAILIIRSAIQKVPFELEEAARLEGASHVVLFRDIILPLIRPAVVTAGFIAFTLGWSEFAVGWAFITSPSHVTLAMALAGMRSENDVAWGLLAAMALFVALPVVVLFYLLRRYVVAAWSSLTLNAAE